MASELIIDTSLNTKGIDAGADKVNKTMSNLGQTVQKTADSMSKSLNDAFKGNVSSETFTTIQQQLDALEKRYAGLKENQQRFLDLGGNVNDSVYKQHEKDLAALSIRIDETKAKMQEMNSEMATQAPAPAIEGVKESAEDIVKSMEKVFSAEVKAIQESDHLREIGDNTVTSNQKVRDLEQELTSLKARLKELSGAGVGLGTEEFDRSTVRVKEIEKELSKYKNSLYQTSSALRTTSNAQKTVNSTARKGPSIFNRLTSAMQKQKSSFGGGFKNVLKYAFGIRSLFVLVNKLRGALIDGFKNMAQFNGGVNPVNSALSNLKSSLTQLKNSFATAFAPILTTIEPILTKFINYLSDAITALGMFFAKLTGASTFTKATRVQQQYAQATQNSANAQEELNKKLASYDKLAVVDKKESNNSTNGGGADMSAVKFETVNLSDSAVNWAEKFREAWENADFTDIGRTVGQKLARALDDIPWDDIQRKCQQIARSIGTFINGFVDSGIFGAIGRTLANALNTALATTDTFLTTIDWSNLGTAISTSITEFFRTFDFSLLGRTVSDLLVAGLDLVSGLINGIDWRNLPRDIANSIRDVLTGVNWSNLFSSLGNVAASILSAIINFDLGLVQVLGDVAGKIKDYFVTKIREAGWSSDNTLLENGKALIIGIFNGIVDFLSSVGTWIRDNILNPFIDGFKNAFSIHSPTTNPTLVSFGSNIIEGIFNGAISWMSGIKDWIKTNVLDKFVSGWNSAKQGMQELALTIKAKFNETKESLKEKWNNITSGIKNKVATAKMNISQKWNDIKGKWNDIVKNIKDQNPKIAFAIQKWTEVKNSLKTIVNNIITWLNSNFIGKLNKLFKVSIPDNAVTQFLGIAGLNKQIISIPKIPKLATGAVIPPNHEFLAMLGDQKSGVNIETPLDTMIQAFETALDRRGGGAMPESIRVYLNESSNRPLAEAVWDEEQKYYKQTGMRPGLA